MRFKEKSTEAVITAGRKAVMKRRKAIRTIEARIVTKKCTAPSRVQVVLISKPSTPYPRSSCSL